MSQDEVYVFVEQNGSPVSRFLLDHRTMSEDERAAWEQLSGVTLEASILRSPFAHEMGSYREDYSHLWGIMRTAGCGSRPQSMLADAHIAHEMRSYWGIIRTCGR